MKRARLARYSPASRQPESCALVSQLVGSESEYQEATITDWDISNWVKQHSSRDKTTNRMDDHISEK